VFVGHDHNCSTTASAFYSVVGITSVFSYSLYWRIISILYRIKNFRHITSTLGNVCIVVHTILFATRIGTPATRGATALPIAVIPMLSSMFELLFNLFDFLIGIFCFLFEVNKGAPFHTM
jgi:hypothetical protein